MFIFNDHAGEIIYAVLAEAPVAIADDVCCNEIASVSCDGDQVRVYDINGYCVVCIAAGSAVDAVNYASAMKLIA